MDSIHIPYNEGFYAVHKSYGCFDRIKNNNILSGFNLFEVPNVYSSIGLVIDSVTNLHKFHKLIISSNKIYTLCDRINEYKFFSGKVSYQNLSRCRFTLHVEIVFNNRNIIILL